MPLAEHQAPVRIVIEPEVNWTERPARTLKWAGDPDELRRLAIDP